MYYEDHLTNRLFKRALSCNDLTDRWQIREEPACLMRPLHIVATVMPERNVSRFMKVPRPLHDRWTHDRCRFSWARTTTLTAETTGMGSDGRRAPSQFTDWQSAICNPHSAIRDPRSAIKANRRCLATCRGEQQHRSLESRSDWYLDVGAPCATSLSKSKVVGSRFVMIVTDKNSDSRSLEFLAA